MRKLMGSVVALSLLCSFGFARADEGSDETATTPTKTETCASPQGSASGEPEHEKEQPSRPAAAAHQNNAADAWWTGGGT